MPYPFIPCLFSAVFPAFAAGFEARQQAET